jgi:hypothetical protein
MSMDGVDQVDAVDLVLRTLAAESVFLAGSVQAFREAALLLERGRLRGQLAVQQAARYGD